MQIASRRARTAAPAGEPAAIGTIRRALLAALALAATAGPARAELVLSINNRSCGILTVELPGAPPCGPDGRICSVVARNGFITKLAVDQSFNDDFLRLTARGDCAGRNARLAGECTVKIGKVTQRDRSAAPYASPLVAQEVYIKAQATLVTIEIAQSICDEAGGERKCELVCRGQDQQ